MTINREQLAWAAGLFEEEGSFTVARRGKYLSIVAELGMTDKDRVQQFHQLIGIGNVTIHSSKMIDKLGIPYKTMYVWKTASFEGVQFVIALLWEWLGPRRRAKAKEILKAYHDNTAKRFTLALPNEVNEAKKLLAMGMSKRVTAKLIGRSYGFVNHIKQGRTHIGTI